MKKPIIFLLFLLCLSILAKAGGISGTVYFQGGRSEKFLDAKYIKGYFRNDRPLYRTGDDNRTGSLLTLYNSAYRWVSFSDIASIVIQEFDFDEKGDLTNVRVEIRLKNGRTMRNRYIGLETFFVSMDSPVYGTHDKIGLMFRERLEDRSLLNIRRIVFD